MEYRNLGKSGLRVSELSYGSWVTFSFQLDKTKAKKTMKHAYDASIVGMFHCLFSFCFIKLK